ncbi:MAG: alanine--tRNA ligase, partial [Lachnospira sp.]|nr:alanine--tRNA ligase [Lachnospira sp.]
PQLIRRINAMNEEIKALSSENDKLKAQIANNALGDVSNDVKEVKGVKYIAAKVDNVDMNELRNLGDKLKGEIGSGVVLIVSAQGDKVNMIAMATDDVIAKGAHAGNLIKAVASIVGGGGGGRPNMAQAGGKNPTGIDELLAKVPEVLEGQIK